MSVQLNDQFKAQMQKKLGDKYDEKEINKLIKSVENDPDYITDCPDQEDAKYEPELSEFVKRVIKGE